MACTLIGPAASILRVHVHIHMSDGVHRLELCSGVIPTVSCVRNRAHLQVMSLAEVVVSAIAGLKAPREQGTACCVTLPRTESKDYLSFGSTRSPPRC